MPQLVGHILLIHLGLEGRHGALELRAVGALHVRHHRWRLNSELEPVALRDLALIDEALHHPFRVARVVGDAFYLPRELD